jgi:hypothetical protein
MSQGHLICEVVTGARQVGMRILVTCGTYTDLPRPYAHYVSFNHF